MKRVLILFFLFIYFSNTILCQPSWYPVNNFNPTPSFFYGIDASFINDSVGYVIGDNGIFLYKTTDKGETWDSISTNLQPLGYRSLAFANDTLGFIGTLNGSGPISSFAKTLDGGHNWMTLVDSLFNPLDGVCGIEIYDNRVIAVGNWQGPGLFYKSDDWGTTWTIKNLSPLVTGLVDCHFINKDTILVSGVRDSAGYWRGIILKSWDGGQSWQEVFKAKGDINIIWKIFIRPSGKGLASVQNVAPVLDSTRIAVTNDFGTTWEEITVPQIPLNYYAMGGVCLLNDTLGWFSSEYAGETYETHDGGYNWSLLPGVAGINRFCVLDSTTVVAPSNFTEYAWVAKYGYSTVNVKKNTSNTMTRQRPSVTVVTNPVNDLLKVETEALLNTRAILQIVNSEGKIVKELFRGNVAKGKRNFNYTLNLSPGFYFLSWLTNEGFVSQKFEVVKN